MRGFEPGLFSGLNSISNFILLVFGMYFTLVLFRSHMIERMWALQWGLAFLGISVLAPVISSLVITAQIANAAPYSNNSIVGIVFAFSFGCLALSCMLCLGAMLPRLVFVPPERTGPVRNPFED